MSATLVLCVCPDAGIAQRMAIALVEERLAACVNRLPGIASTYVWNHELCTDDGVLLLIKTTAASFSALEARVLEMHPDQVPELIALPIERGHAPYLAWLRDAVDAPIANEARPKRS